jgi:integrase
MPRKRQEPTVTARSYRLADGSETTTYSVRYVDLLGRRRRASFATREEADFERARIVLELASVTTPPVQQLAPRQPAGDTTLGEFWAVWLADARSRLSRKTISDHERQWRNRVAPRFAHLPLGEIKPRLVAQWRAELLADGAGPGAVIKAMVLLQAMFTVAIEWGEADANPVTAVRKPKQGPRRAVVPIPPEGVERLRREFLDEDDLRSAALVSVMAYAGLRPGEALALETRHIRESTILVEQAVSDGELKRQKTGRLYRTVDLLPVLAGDLADHLETTPETDGLLFPRADGDPWRTDDWDNWRNRRFFPAAERAGLGRRRPYDLRHSFASLMVREQRTSVVELAEQLGHAPTMTLNTYAHVFAEHRRAEPVDANEWIEHARAEIWSSCG